MKWLVDAGIGEMRAVLVENGAPVAIRIWRDPALGAVARNGDIYGARVVSRDKARRLAFLDLGAGEAFLPLDAKGEAPRAGGGARAVREGERLLVRIAREAARGKRASAELLDGPAPDSEGLVRLGEAPPVGTSDRAAIDAVIDAALSRYAPIPGGGVLAIEPTAALVAIDVDAADRAGAGDAAKFSLDLNIAAGREALRQLRLRALGGVFAIDFVAMTGQRAAEALALAMKAQAASDPCSVTFAPLSRYGVLEGARAQAWTPLHEVLCDDNGRLSVTSCALSVLRAIEREGVAQRGRPIRAAAAPDIVAWLEQSPLDWRAALNAQLGPRWTLTPRADLARDRCDVSAL
ncbi:MAG: ribonuclease E/G [Caulobacterales bacterium]